MIETLLAALTAHGRTLAVAESLTGGLVASTIVEVPGASEVFRGGVVAYATEVKGTVLGVPGELLATRGAVDPEVATAMAEGVARLVEADLGLATTGVAGPSSQDGQPPGTVFVAACDRSGGVSVVRGFEFPGDRQAVRGQAASSAFDLLAELMQDVGLLASNPAGD